MERVNGTQYAAFGFGLLRNAADAFALRRAMADALGPTSRIARAREGFAVAVSSVPERADLRAMAEEARHWIAERVGDASLSVGVAGPCNSTIGANIAVLQAEQALLMGRCLRGAGCTIAFHDLGPYCFVLGQPRKQIREFSERLLGPLARQDDARAAELVETLEAYLRSNGSVNEVARRLYLHRNTVRHRLRRVAELTGADLRDADARLALHLAILGRRALSQMGL